MADAKLKIVSKKNGHVQAMTEEEFKKFQAVVDPQKDKFYIDGNATPEEVNQPATVTRERTSAAGSVTAPATK